VKLVSQTAPVVLAKQAGVRVAEDGGVGHEDDGADGGDDGEDEAGHRQLLVLRRGDGDGTRGDEDERDDETWQDTCEDWQVGVQVSKDFGGQVYQSN